jgi:tetratricopeptide (TPR) repeat protein
MHSPVFTNRFLFVLLSWTALALVAFGQDQEATLKLRLAQSFEQSGEWERAVGLYEQLLESDPLNYLYFDGLRRGYIQLKKYDKAIDLVQQRLIVQRDDPNLLAMLGGLYYQSGKASTADSLWQLVIAVDPKNTVRYRIVANQLIEHRQYEKAMRIYQAARTATQNDEYFMDEIATLSAALQQYEGATREYVRMIRLRPQQLSYAQARMSSFTGREEGRKAALRVLQEEVRQSPESVPLRSLLAWICMEGKDFESALNEYRFIDRLSGAEGMELYHFAQRAAQERSYLVAAKAFREVIEQQRQQRILPLAKLGYARAIEELSVHSDTLTFFQSSSESAPAPHDRQASPVSESRPSFQGALQLYESLAEEYPSSDVAMQAQYRIGFIRFHRFFDLDGAAAAFDRVRRTSQNPDLALDATLSLAEVYVAQNQLSGARSEYVPLLNSPQTHRRDLVLFRLAELDYFEGHPDSAQVRLKSITANTSTDLANDALQLLYFIQANAVGAPAALREFAKADLLVRQRKHAEALLRFQHILKTFPHALLIDDGMLRIAELHLLLGQTDQALQVLRALVEKNPPSTLRDRAQMKIGEVFEFVLRDVPNAIAAYEQILTQHPTSLYVEEARKRIRLLRGDAL